MSQVFTCRCGRKTTQPFVINGAPICVVCAEEEAPTEVDRRERREWRQYQAESYHTKAIPKNRFGH